MLMIAVLAVQGLALPSAEPFEGNARAPHTKAHTAYLSGARAKYTEGADIELGNISVALTKCSSRWASLPGAGYGQHINSMDSLLAAYVNAGGTGVTLA